tara:strand:+ start:70341 stop:70955 length:615 start_codon:yes stop_codon:yes gene_type:complete
MFLTKHFVFVHIPKTGGNFVHRILQDHAPADWELKIFDVHATYAEIPESHRHLPRLAFARNPFSWHVSWFHFQQQERDAFYMAISDNGTLGFKDAMRRAYTGNGVLANSSGALTQTLFEMLGEGLEGAKVGKIESMREELLRMFGECTEVPTKMVEAIQQVPPQNTSTHAHYSTYYDPELRDLVRQKDAPVFDYFGYQWEDAPP